MHKETLSQVFARNLAAAMAERDIKQAQLAKGSGVAQTTISLYLSPDRRLPTEGKSQPGPTLERISQLANALQIEPWLLLHPDMDRARRERAMYQRIEEDFERNIRPRLQVVNPT